MLKFEMYEDLPRDIIDALWNQDINIDDWDYVLFLEEEFAAHFTRESDHLGLGCLVADSYEVDKLLAGSAGNTWYEVVDFMGRKGILGIAYHS